MYCSEKWEEKILNVREGQELSIFTLYFILKRTVSTFLLSFFFVPCQFTSSKQTIFRVAIFILFFLFFMHFICLIYSLLELHKRCCCRRGFTLRCLLFYVILITVLSIPMFNECLPKLWLRIWVCQMGIQKCVWFYIYHTFR